MIVIPTGLSDQVQLPVEAVAIPSGLRTVTHRPPGGWQSNQHMIRPEYFGACSMITLSLNMYTQ